MKIKHFLTRLVLATVVAAALAVGALAGTAKALNPDQTDVVTIVNTVYWDLDAFWIPVRRPGVGYYNWYSGYQLVDYQTPCGHSAYFHGSEGFYCRVNESIHIDYLQQAGNVSRFGDGSLAFWAAHEYGHHIYKLLNLDFRVPYNELVADCFAGMYFNRSVNVTRKLKPADLQEARNQIWALPDNDPGHGSRAQRLNAFDFGYRQVNRNFCVYGAAVNY